MQTNIDTFKANTQLWNTVRQTDPAMTRQVNQRGGFTAIDSYYQIQRATELFGPLGKGWGYDAEFRFEHNLAIAIVKMWYVWDGQKSEPFTICASNQLVSIDKTGRQHIDEDAAKKALTDALTKGLSYLGFSTDVFMGKFDDSRYVNELKHTMRQQQEERDLRLDIAELQDELQLILDGVKDAPTYRHARDKMIPHFLRLKSLAPHLACGYETAMVELKRKYAATPALNPPTIDGSVAAKKAKRKAPVENADNSRKELIAAH